MQTREHAMNNPKPAAALPTTILQKVGHVARFMVFLCSAGWLYPHASTEGMDLTQILKDRMASKP